MKLVRAVAPVLIAVTSLVAAAPQAWAWSDSTSHMDGQAKGRFVSLSTYEVDVERSRIAKSAPSERLVEFWRAYPCGVDSEGITPSDSPCGPRNQPLVAPDCGDDDPIPPLWYRDRVSADSPWSDWQMAYGWTCPVDHLPPLTAADFRRLPLADPALTMQPERGWVLVNKPTIAYSANEAQTLHTSLLGHPVTVRATPSAWTWDYGDGYRTTTTTPGHPYPDQDVWHAYTKLATHRITLTVTWTAQYQYDEYPTWRDVDGTATTTASTSPFTVEERRGHLVAETCNQNPHAPGC